LKHLVFMIQFLGALLASAVCASPDARARSRSR